MQGQYFTSRYRTPLFAAATLLTTGVSGSVPAQGYGREAHSNDGQTCETFGAVYSSRGYSTCMRFQQERRDNAPLKAAEQQRLSVEAARNNVEASAEWAANAKRSKIVKADCDRGGAGSNEVCVERPLPPGDWDRLHTPDSCQSAVTLSTPIVLY
jgi:hypothetical protein